MLFLTVITLVCVVIFGCLAFGILYAVTDDRDLEFLHSESEIKMIEIVEVVGDPEGNYVKGGPKQTVVAEVENTVTFMKELKAIKGHYMTPSGIDYDCIAIRITYFNDEYDLIHYNGQSDYTEKSGFYYDSGRAQLNKEAYIDLIKKYAPDVDIKKI